MITYATSITLVRIILVAPIIYALFNNYFLVAALLAVFAAFTDILDGYIARRYNQQSNVGALLDPLADKLFILSTFTALWYCYALVAGELIIFLWVKEILLGLGAWILLVRGSKPTPARLSGKLAMICQCFYGLLLFFTRYTGIIIPTLLNAVLALVVIVTLYALVDYGNVGYRKLTNP